MSRLTPEERASLVADGASAERREELRAAERKAAAGSPAPAGIEAMLDWVDALREAFGEPAVDLRPWRGEDFRL